MVGRVKADPDLGALHPLYLAAIRTTTFGSESARRRLISSTSSIRSTGRYHRLLHGRLLADHTFGVPLLLQRCGYIPASWF